MVEYDAIVNFIVSLWAPAQYVFVVLGGLVVIGTCVDKLVPDQYDKGFMSKIFAIPYAGAFLKHIAKFSPFYEADKK